MKRAPGHWCPTSLTSQCGSGTWAHRHPGWPKAMVQKETMEEGEEGQRYWGGPGEEDMIKGKNVGCQTQS